MSNPIIHTNDVQLGIVNERPMTDTEHQHYLEIQKENQTNAEAVAQALQARASALAKLEALGLTPAEIAALVG